MNQNVAQLAAILKLNQVVAINRKGKATIFDVNVNQPPAALERWGWKVVQMYVPPAVKVATKAAPGRKPKLK